MRVLVAIPLYNEAATAADVLRAIRRWAPPAAEVLVIDDGSTDGSATALPALPGVTTLTHATNQGYGAALIAGFHHALRHRHDAVVTMDCDAQHEPHLIPHLLHALDRADIVSGSRYLPGSCRGDPTPRDRLHINQEMTHRINALTGFGITDAFCGFKAYRAGALARLQLDEPSYGMPLQAWLQAARAQLRVHEVAIGRIYRDHRRRFAGRLDDPGVRRHYYLEVINKEVRRWRPRSSF